MNNDFELILISSDGKKMTYNVNELYVNILESGVRGFLKNHVDFMGLLGISSFYVVINKTKKYFTTSGGVLSFKKNKATILTDTFEAKEEIDRARAIKEKEEAEKILKNNDNDVDVKKAELSLKKAINRLSIL